MPRVKRGVISMKRRRKVLKQTKGYTFGRSTKEREAKQAILRAGSHAYAHRRDKKNDFRRLWQMRISAAVKPFELSYSRFAGLLREKNIGLNRKMLSELAHDEPEVFSAVVEKAKS